MTNSVGIVEDTTPPTIETAIRYLSSQPVPVLHRIVRRPAMMGVTLIIFGRTR